MFPHMSINLQLYLTMLLSVSAHHGFFNYVRSAEYKKCDFIKLRNAGLFQNRFLTAMDFAVKLAVLCHVTVLKSAIWPLSTYIFVHSERTSLYICTVSWKAQCSPSSRGGMYIPMRYQYASHHLRLPNLNANHRVAKCSIRTMFGKEPFYPFITLTLSSNTFQSEILRVRRILWSSNTYVSDWLCFHGAALPFCHNQFVQFTQKLRFCR
jgi:hypothetical protein